MIENLFGGGGGGGGTVDTVVAGTGISVNSTDPANPIVTLGNHDASLITTGTVATARLGTGTANSTTYLAGDQTYKAAVTSVNGSTGAVTVAAGDTTYTVTTADAENTTSKITIASFTVPANTWADGETISLVVRLQMLGNSGSPTVTTYVSGTTITEASATATFTNNAAIFRAEHEYTFTRLGNSVIYPFGTSTSGTFYYFHNPIVRAYDYYREDAAVTFSSNITINLAAQFSVANASNYIRVLYAKAIKTSAGQQ